MLRPTSLLPALVAVVATLAGVSPPAAADPAAPPVTTESVVRPAPAQHLRAARPRPPATEQTPLSVTIDSLSPSYIPRKGPIRVTGSVTNEDEDTWTSVSVYSFVGRSPITTTADLDAASRLDPATDVGPRITTPGTYDKLDRIEPGQTLQFSIKVPRSAIDAASPGVSAPGVYWFGVHALGTGPDGRIEGADGRARTFLPLMPPTRRPEDVALVLPLRRTMSYAPDGSMEDVEGWNTALAPGGRLRTMVDLGTSAGTRPITWLLDPALPDVVRNLTLGNPPRILVPSPEEASGDASSSATPTPSPTPSEGSSGDEGDESGDQALAAVADSGNAWLDRLHEALTGREILALPYGDLDVSAAAEHRPAFFRQARRRSGTELAPWGLRMTPAVASPSGFLGANAMRQTPGGAIVLLTDRMFGSDAPAVSRLGRARMVTTASAVSDGGPGPDDPRSAVALRQRILAEAALRLLDDRRPLVAVLPSYWTPTSTTGFFEGLDVPWLHLTTVDDVASRTPRTVTPDQLDYPDGQRRRELDVANFSSAESLIRVGETLQNVLTDNDTVASTVADQAMAGTSYGHRATPDGARAATDRSRSWIDQELGSITIDAPPAVTLSSTSGRFAATLTNGLDEPVTVSIQALTDEPHAIRGPEKVDIGPGGRTTVLLNASFRNLGVHNVTLVMTDADGVRLGSSDQLPIRSAQVSQVIWLFLGTGVALLFGAIAVRLVRRVRASARTTTKEETA